MIALRIKLMKAYTFCNFLKKIPTIIVENVFINLKRKTTKCVFMEDNTKSLLYQIFGSYGEKKSLNYLAQKLTLLEITICPAKQIKV